MNFWQEHFDHLLLSIFIVLFAGGMLFLMHSHANPSEYAWLGAGFTNFTGALLMRMRGGSGGNPNGNGTPKP